MRSIAQRVRRKVGNVMPFDLYHRIQRARGFPRIVEMFERDAGYSPDLNTPVTFNEKLTHRKLTCRDPRWITVTDKVAVRDHLKARGLPEGLHLIPVHGIYDSVEALAAARLPESFIAKAAWASARHFICHDIDTQRETLLQRAETWFMEHPRYRRRQLIWPPSHIPARILIEEFLGSAEAADTPNDYKFFVFHGTCRFFHVDEARFSDHVKTFFDRDLNVMPVTYDAPMSEATPLPDTISDMIRIAEALGAEFDFVRVDLYSHGGRIYFGELTQTPMDGKGPWEPAEYDRLFGSYWQYP